MTAVASEPRARVMDPFITKVLPPKRPFGLIRRERLHQTLARAVERHRAALITAPAGYGKTSLVADFLADVSAPVCWYSADPEDNDVRSFLHYLVLAIQHQFPDFGDGIRHQLNSSADLRPLLKTLTGALVSEIQQRIDEWFVLVLEDLHWCDDPDVLTALDLFLRHVPENCFVLLTSRTRLSLSALARLSAQRALTRLNSQDLSFTEAEVSSVLTASGHKPDQETAKRLAEESEGWVAGIILLAPWLDRPSPLGSLEGEAGREELFWYLSEQVLQRLPERCQDLLTRSAVLHDVSADICKEAFGFDDAAALLKQMAESGIFVTELRDGVTFRYHALLRQFLLDRAARERQPIAAWHCRVAEFYAGRGRCAEAVTHYLAGGDPISATHVLEAGAPSLYHHGAWALLAKLVTALQREGTAGPTLALWHARCLLQLGDPDAAIALAEAYGNALGDTADLMALALSEITRAGALRSKGNVASAIAAAQRALAHIADLDENAQTVLLRAEAHHYIGASQATAGLYRDALPELRGALALYESLDATYHLAKVHSAIGACLYRLGRHPEGIEHYEVAIEASRRLGNHATLASTLNNLGSLYVSIGAFTLAQEVLRSALEAARLCANTRVEAYAMQTLGTAFLGNLQFEEAIRTFRDAVDLTRRSGETVLEARALLALAQALSYAGALAEAREIVEQAGEMIPSSPTAYDGAMLSFSRGLLALRGGDAAQAKEALVDALQRFAQSGDIHWTEAASLLLAQVAFEMSDLPAATAFLHALRGTLRTDDGAAALRLEAGLAHRVLGFAVEQLADGALFARLFAAPGPAAPAAPLAPPRTLERPLVKALSLGAFAVEINGTPVDESRGLTSKAKELLIYLLTTGRRARREELLEALWPDTGAAKDASVLRTNVYRLRKVLYDQCIQVQGDLYRIDPGGLFWFDLQYFKELIQRSHRSDCSPVERTMLLETAVKLYGGPFLNDISAEWCLAERYDADVKFVGAALSLARVYLESNNPAAALELCDRVLAGDPLNEDAILLQVRAHIAMGNRPHAILHWRSYEQRLEAETGSRPSCDAALQYEGLVRAS
jgi:LuxR family maltose regulon positive regulatory protein